jgi:hypothetical protein
MEISEAEAKALLEAPEDELFRFLVPEAEKVELHSFDGISARGRIIFRAAFLDVRDQVCALRGKAGQTFGNQVDLLALIAAAIVGQVSLLGIPAVPMAALILKIGLGKLCENQEPTSD